MSTKNEIRILVEWKNADYFEISHHLEDTFEKSFSGSGVSIGDATGDASFYVYENQVESFISLLTDEMENLKDTYKRMKYRIGKESDFYTEDGDYVRNSAPLV
jgi:hypothetical protein